MLANALLAALVALEDPAGEVSGTGFPCADSSLYAEDQDFGEEGYGVSADDTCGEEESLLFPRPRAAAPRRDLERASFSAARAADAAPQSVLRQRAERDGWSDRVEVRGDSLTRRQLGWSGGGWRLLAGDLTDTVLSVWPRWLPRRRLPAGWKPARGDRPSSPAALSSSLPQGLAAGIAQPGWTAYALRSWNPVETGKESPWKTAWGLRHAAAGASVSLPWIPSIFFSETRVSRGQTDSVAERVASAGLAAPHGGLAFDGALSQARDGGGTGWAAGMEAHPRFGDRAKVDFTVRQRGARWRSSWDPASSPAADAEDSAGPDGGAGEYLLGGSVPFRKGDDRIAVAAETWRVWNPAAGTGRRGARGRADWRRDDLRLRASGTDRTSRAASGSVSVYRYLELESIREGDTRWSAAAYRAWDAHGPTRKGLRFGADRAWRETRWTAGSRIEADKNDRLAEVSSLALRWRFSRGWNLDAVGYLPCYPRVDGNAARWRVTVTYAAAGPP